MNQQEGYNQDTPSIAALLRMAADGELDAQQEIRLRAHLEAHPEDEQRIEFDRQLRCACRRACSPERCAPESLRDRIRACCCETDEALADGLAARAHQTRSPGFWAGRLVVRFGAVAALIALVAVVAVMVGKINPAPGTNPDGILRTSMAEQVASFVLSEHDRCANMPPKSSTKFTVREVKEVPAIYESLVGQSVPLESVFNAAEHGLTFVDAGECHLPPGTALHIRFRTDNPEAGLVSLWIQPNDEKLNLLDDITYTCGEECICVRFWQTEGVRYVLVTPNLDLAPPAGEALHCPTMSLPIQSVARSDHR